MDLRTAGTLRATKYFQSEVEIIFKQKEDKYFFFRLRPQMGPHLKYVNMEFKIEICK